MEAAEIIAIRDHRRDKVVNTLHNRWEEVLSYYRLQERPKVPGDFKSHIPPTARTVPETLAAALSPNEIQVSVGPRTEKKGAKGAEDQATKLEAFHKDNLDRLDKAQGYSLIGELLKQDLMFGMSVLKGPFLNIKMWPKEPEGQGEKHDHEKMVWENRCKAILPLKAYVRSPLNIFPDPKLFNGEDPSDVIESYKRPYSEVSKYMPMMKKDFDEVEWTEFHSATQRIYMIGDVIVDKQENPYGRPPYHFSFSGLGIISPDGRPEDRAVGVMWPILDLLAAEIRTLTMWDIVAQIYGVPPFKKDTDYEGSVDLTPAAENPKGKSVTPMFERIPGVGQILLELLAVIHDQIELATYSRTLAAVKLAGVSTGIQQQLITLQAYKRYQPMIGALEYLWGRVGSDIAWIVEEELQKDVNEHIKYSEINGYYECDVKFRIVDQLQRQIDIEEMNMLKPFYSIETLREKYQPIQAAVDEAERMVTELLVQSPLVLEPLAAESYRRAGGQELLDKVEGLKEGARKRKFTPPVGAGIAQQEGKMPVEEEMSEEL